MTGMPSLIGHTDKVRPHFKVILTLVTDIFPINLAVLVKAIERIVTFASFRNDQIGKTFGASFLLVVPLDTHDISLFGYAL